MKFNDESQYPEFELTEKIIKEVYNVYNKLGYGFLEKVYGNALMLRLDKIGLKVEYQKPIKVNFEGEIVGEYFADIVVNSKVILELKAIEKLDKIHEVQLVNYLKATGIQIGLLINFGRKIEIRRKIFSSNF